MPTSLIVNGQRTYIPGVYGQVIADGLANPGVSLGNLALVGDFPQIQNDVPTTYLSAKALRALDSNDIKYARLAKLIFNPSLDTRVSNGAASVTLVNAGTVAQAYSDVADAGGVGVLHLASKLWGVKGNQAWFKITDNLVAGKDVTITAPGKTGESFTGLGAPSLLAVKLTTGPAANNTSLDGANDTCKLEISSADVWKLRWTKRLTAGVAWAPAAAHVPTDSRILEIKVGADSGAAMAIVVTGVGMKGATPVTTATFSLPQLSQNDAWVEIKDGADTVVWSHISNITNNDNGAPAVTIDVRGTALQLDGTTLPKLTDVATAINNLNSAYITADLLDPRAYSLATTEVDKLAEVTCKNAFANVDAHLWAILEGLATSQIVTATRSSALSKLPPTTVPAGRLLALGSEASASTADYEGALATLENKDVQTVVCMSTDVEVHKKLAIHVINAAAKFGRERDGVVGVPSATALATIKSAYVAKLNSRNLSVYGDKIKIAPVSFGDVATWLDPSYTAVLAAACMCAQNPGQALTRRTVDVLDISHSWTDGTDENSVIPGGISALTTNNLGNFMFLRSVTSWIQDNSPAYSEVGANASVNISIRDLRAYLTALIGDSIEAGMSPGTIESMVRERLTQQRDSYKWIKGFSDIKATLLVDTWSIDYLVDEMQAINFILVTEHVKAG